MRCTRPGPDLLGRASSDHQTAPETATHRGVAGTCWDRGIPPRYRASRQCTPPDRRHSGFWREPRLFAASACERLAWSILVRCAFGSGARVVRSLRRDRRRCGMEAIRPVWSCVPLAGRWWCWTAGRALESSAGRSSSSHDLAAIRCRDRLSSGTPTGTTSRVCRSSNRSLAVAGGTCTGREDLAVRWTRRLPVR